MEKKTVTICGLGVFGSALAKTLGSYNADVIAIDKNMERIERIKDYVADAVCLDFTNIEDLKAAGVSDSDIGVICTSGNLECAVLGTANLKELGIEKIICKSNNDTYSTILKKVGADQIVSPEKEVAFNLAKKLVAGSFLELLDVDKDYSVYDFLLPSSWQGKTLIELNARKKYHVNIIGIRRAGKLIIDFDPNEKLSSSDEILMIGKSDLFKKGNIF